MTETPHTVENGLSEWERDLLDQRDRYGQIKQGYYVGFDATGVPEVDRLLAAIGWAGKAYHHTEGWHEDDAQYGPLSEGVSPADLIQRAANDAARALSTRPIPPGSTEASQ